MKVWLVWTEEGSYEQFNRDLRGVFAVAEMAEAHAAQIRAERERYDVVEVKEEEVLNAVPENVPFIEWSAHILPDGTEDHGLGYTRGEKYRAWTNEITPASGRLGKWHGNERPDLFVEVVGSDGGAVAAEYERLLAEARRRLGASE